MYKLIYSCLLFSCFPLFGENNNITPPKIQLVSTTQTISDGPVLVGPLLSPSGQTLPSGHIDFEPYLFVNSFIGYYDNNWHFVRSPEVFESINFFLFTQYGLNNFLDFAFMPQLFYNSYCNIDSAQFGDLFYEFGLQLVQEDNQRGIPSIKLLFGQSVPTGRFDELDPEKFSTQISGIGYFNTLFALVASYVWALKPPHYFDGRICFAYWYASKTKVRGLSAFGGDPTTRGMIAPGDLFEVLIGLEYTLTRYWALALDIESDLFFPTKFKGCTIDPVGINAISYQLSFAPAIEYNYSHNLGVILGVWFTAIGRNSTAFINGVLAMNFYL